MTSSSEPPLVAQRALARDRILGFDGLRAIAVVLVFLQHKISDRWALGEMGVRIFFVLSGFLIVGILHEQRRRVERGGSRREEWLQFWKRRGLRIFPIYYLTLVVVGITIAMKEVSVAGFASYWLFANNVFLYSQALETGAVQWSAATPVVHFWTLAVEQQFYLLASVAILLSSTKRHVGLMYCLIGISLLSFAHQAIFDSNNYYNSLLPAQNLIYLAAGGLLRLQGAPSVPLAWLGAIAALVSIVLLHPLHNAPWVIGYAQPVLGLVGAWCFVAHVVRFQSGAVVRWLAVRPLAYLGTISYGFYVYHQLPPGLEYFAGALGLDPSLKSSRYVWATWSFAVTLALAAASWRFLERPLLKRNAKVERAGNAAG